MDIRKYFGGGAKTQAKKDTPAPVSSKSKSKSPKPPLAGKKSKPDSTKSKSNEVVVIDSDSCDAPIKVKHKNISKEEKKEVVEKKKSNVKKSEKDKKSGEKEKESKTGKVAEAAGSPGEKENKEIEKKADKPKKEERSKSSERTERKTPAKNEKEKESITPKERNKKKRKSTVISSSDDEEFQNKIKANKNKSKKGRVIFDSDSDEEPIPPTPKSAEKKRSRRRPKPTNCLSDSDEEKQTSIVQAFSKVPTKKTPNKEKGVKAVKKTCSVADFFGGASVHRVERKVTSVKRKAETSHESDDPFADDLEIHDDEEFEKTLLQLDEIQHTPKKAKIEKKSAASSLASKLSAKAKVEESPEISKSRKTSDVSIVEDSPEKSKGKVSPGKNPKISPDKPKPAAKKSPVTPKTTAQNQKTSPKKISPQKTTQAEDSPMLKRGNPSFRSYLQRAGPQALGSKEIPEGEANCLEGLTFVLSGVLESIERDDCKELVERLGGKVTTSLSKKTSYIVLGRDAGVSKTAKAEQLGTKQLDEDALFDLIRKSKGKKSKYEIAAEADSLKGKQQTPKAKKASVSASPATTPHIPKPSTPSSSSRPSTSSSHPSTSSPQPSPTTPSSDEEAGLMWVDKYKPKSLKQVIGQQGAKSNANKLMHWLKNWHKWVAEGRKPNFNRFGDNDGAGCRAALLSGPPGVGKTTTATLVCQEAGFSFVELNASDTRSKKSLETEVAELLGNHTLVDFFGKSEKSATEGKKHCLVMDEVDGMSGNQDRGGMQELIQLIKKSKIPIICMCNDRNHQKVRSLANYCFDLRFQRPRMEQIKAAMMSLAYKEGVKIPPPALNEMITAANQDVRQVIHNLSMWTAANKSPTYDQVKTDAAKAAKDMKIGPFDVCRKVFVGGEETAKMTIHDKTNLFFQDYSFGPLFVHENYLHADPYSAAGDKNKRLECISRAIDSIADGDLVDRIIRREQKWSLLPTQAMYSSVIPGDTMRGRFSTMVQFPQWLGKNSSTNKTDRILQELSMHMSLRISGDKRALNMDYLPFMRAALTKPLVQKQQEGVPEVIGLMDDYALLREDFDNLLDITQWSHRPDPYAGLDSKTKSAFTRAYNKEAHLQPYAAVVTAKKGRGRGGGGAGAGEEMDPYGEGEGEGEEEEKKSDDDDPTMDAMIKAKKKPGKAGGGGQSSRGKGKGQASTRGSGRGRGRGRGKNK